MHDLAKVIAEMNNLAVKEFENLSVTKPFNSYTFSKDEDLGLGTQYILKTNGDNWLVIKKNYTDTTNEMLYASDKNNSGISKALAWTNRATLAYVDSTSNI